MSEDETTKVLAEAHQRLEALERRLQVEEALERVRVRALAMRHSDELASVAAVMLREEKALGIKSMRSGIGITAADESKADVWTAGITADGKDDLELTFHFPLEGHPRVEGLYAAWKNQDDWYLLDLSGDDLTDFIQFLKRRRAGPSRADPAFDVTTMHRVVLHFFPFPEGAVSVVTAAPLSEAALHELRRLADAFAFAYTRYLDLKQAEEQAREAQIEAALERVRSRSMAMRRSDELSAVASVVFKQFEGLGLDPVYAGVAIIKDEAGYADLWLTAFRGGVNPVRIQLPLTGHPQVEKNMVAWRRGDPFLSWVVEGKEAVQAQAEAYAALTGDPHFLSASPSERQEHLEACHTYGTLSIVSYESILAETGAILQRFARVFEQTYRRFLDLKKAEEQAREAQIEAALERVRARSLAMHHSDELAEVSVVLFQQLQALGLRFDLTCVCVFDEPTDTLTIWPTDLEGGLVSRSFAYPLNEDPIGTKMYQAWQQCAPEARKQQVMVTEFVGQDLQELLVWFSILSDYQDDATAQHFREPPDIMIAHDAHFSHGWLSILSLNPYEAAERDMLKRFAGVFEQAYIRFLDLKQAEAQAREARIEAALERVRSRTMAMHHSTELAEAAVVLFNQFSDLAIQIRRCGFAIVDEEASILEIWGTSTNEQGVALNVVGRLRHDQYPMLLHAVESWRRKDAFYMEHLEDDALQAYYQAVATTVSFPQEVQDNILSVTRSEYFHFFNFEQGIVYVFMPRPLTDDECQVIHRFARVFELTYTRFLDLQQAEARAREAVRAASLDRVRAEIATMRTAADLQRITPLVWRELTTLSVPFFRCGVIIIDEANEHVEMFLSNSYGKQLADFRLPFESHPLIQISVATWRNQQVFADQWEQERLLAWMQFLMERGDVAQPDDYMDHEGPPPMLALHLVPFAQGLLYVGSPEPLSDDQVDLVQALADAFAVAYARYEDFKRLEAAKADIEATLDHLKTTQAQLIQAKKMASLGQLTAGIAHEIKNPLNFVNNFAALSTELADELLEELNAHPDKTVAEIRGDLDELLADLRLNTERIHEHGRRADGIVRAMMDHARGGESERRVTNVNALLDEYINLAYHGMRASTPDFNVTIERDFEEAVGEVEIVPQEIGRVFINLLNNAFYAVHRKAASAIEAYVPTVQVRTHHTADAVEIRIEDNGPGIKQALVEKIFEPFYTTKPTGKGTGLGLSLSYDIVTQGHGGMLTVESEEGEGAAFVVCLPAPPAS